MKHVKRLEINEAFDDSEDVDLAKESIQRLIKLAKKIKKSYNAEREMDLNFLYDEIRSIASDLIEAFGDEYNEEDQTFRKLKNKKKIKKNK